MTTLTVGGCFIGIGGIELGLESTGGFETRWYSEVNHNAGRVLRERFPSAASLGDVRELFNGLFGAPDPVDVVTGGPPCQGISKANASGRAGLRDPRSALFYPWCDVLEILRPRWLVMEQVLGLRTSNDGDDYAVVLDTLEGLGYDVEVIAHNSLAYVAQSRARLYFVGCLVDGAASRAVLPARADGASDPHTYRPSSWLRAVAPNHRARAYRKTRRARSDTDGERWTTGEYANTLTLHDATMARATVLVVDDDAVRVMTPVEWERCHGYPDDWTLPAGKDAARYALLGNAVTPPVTARIGEGILAVERELAVANDPDEVCVECGGDLPAEGSTMCLECLERVNP